MVVLAQGREAAQVLAARYAEASVRRWVACDAYAGEVFIRRDIPYVDEAFYLSGDAAPLREIQMAAYRMSMEWYRGVPQTGEGVRTEAFAVRSFDYLFLSVLSAFHFLEKIRAKEGPCELAFGSWLEEGQKGCDLRYQRDGSLVRCLVETFKERWGFRPVCVESSPSGRVQSGRESKDRWRSVASWVNGLRSGDVLFSGNPSLLSPVADVLKKKHGLSSFFIQTNHPPYPKSPEPFPEAERKDIFRDKGTFRFGDVDLLPVVWGKVRSFYRWEAPRLRDLHGRLKAFLGRARPRYVVVDEDVVEFNRVLVHAAKALGIQTVVVSHGLPGAPPGFVPLEADRIAVWGSATEEKLRTWGVSSERIAVTGCPKYDRLCLLTDGHRARKEDLCREWGWEPRRPIALVIPGGFCVNPFERYDGSGSTSSEILRTTDYFLRIARETPGVYFIYKFRIGSHEPDVFQELIRKRGGLPPNMKWAREGLAVSLMPACEVVFNSCSSACLEAVLLQRPVVNMNFSYHPDVFPFIEYGLGVSVRSYEEALGLCGALERGELPLEEWVGRQEGLIRPFVFSRDGKSAERAADFIVNHLSQGGVGGKARAGAA